MKRSEHFAQWAGAGLGVIGGFVLGYFTVRGVPIKRVKSVQALATRAELRHSTRTGIIDSLTEDPHGELTIEVPADLVDANATVLAVDLSPAGS